jgi:hypothetical protein
MCNTMFNLSNFVYSIKHRIPESLLTRDMLLTANMTEAEKRELRWIKMACGENPKR